MLYLETLHSLRVHNCYVPVYIKYEVRYIAKFVVQAGVRKIVQFGIEIYLCCVAYIHNNEVKFVK